MPQILNSSLKVFGLHEVKWSKRIYSFPSVGGCSTRQAVQAHNIPYAQQRFYFFQWYRPKFEENQTITVLQLCPLTAGLLQGLQHNAAPDAGTFLWSSSMSSIPYLLVLFLHTSFMMQGGFFFFSLRSGQTPTHECYKLASAFHTANISCNSTDLKKTHTSAYSMTWK